MEPDPGAILDIAERVGFPVSEAYREGVIVNYARLLQQAALVMSASLPETAEELPDFVP